MEQNGVIAKVNQPTEWCSGMVVVPKANSKVRICVDLTRLNESVKQERHPLPAVDQTLAQLAGAKVFTKLDANSGFWSGTDIFTPDDIHHPVRTIPLPSPAVWHTSGECLKY